MVHWKLLPAIAAFAVIPNNGFGQSDGIAKLNELFGGSVVLKLDKRLQLVIDLYDANSRIRQDVAPLASIDPERLHYSMEEDAVILECREGHDRCFTKELFKLNSVRLTGRCNLPRPPLDDGAAATLDALRALLAAHSATALETPMRGERKN
ncbi:MAG: hypothetical protein IPK70_09610 [Flavobacteriales bacterium]|jgi:hypothetical protein|nr:hypothetical protein [Flavobacteriales bacterium]